MSRKSKRQSWGAFPVIGAIKTGEVKIVNPNYESKEQLLARLRREEAEQREAPVKAAVAEYNQTLLQLRAAQRDALFKFPSEELAAATTAVPEHVTGSVDEIRAQIKSALHTVITELARSGLNLRDSGRDKMLAVSRLNLNVDWRVSANWRKLYEHMSESGLNVFTNEDVTVPKPVVEAPPKPSLDELLQTVSAESTEGRKKLIAAVEDELVNKEWRNCWLGFTDSIYKHFGGYMLTEREKKTFIETMIRRGLNLNRPADYDTCRVALCKSGDLNPALVYPAERLSLELEDADLNDRDVRREFARRTRVLAERS